MSDKQNKKNIVDRFPFLQKLKNIKHIEVYIVCLFLVVIIGVYFSTRKSSNKTTIKNSSEFSAESYASYLEGKLETILGNVAGAGNVSVMISLDGGMKYEYATQSDEVTTSTEVSGNTNTKTEIKEEVVIVTINGKSTPLIVKESYPTVCGVVVVASGASNAQVKLNLMRAITALIEIDEKNIEILNGN